jgi:gluconokinase
MILALDIGTSSARAAAFDDAGRAVDGLFHRVPYEPSPAEAGASEHDPRRLLDAVVACIDAVQARRRREPFRAVGVATFWHGLLGFDSADRPATPIYMWGDTRSTPDARLLASALDEAAVHERTGCHLHPSYWPAKLRWIARERPAEARRVARWGSIGELLELELFGAAATSVSMASGTGLLDQERVGWDRASLAAAGVDEGRLFPLVDRTEGRQGLRPAWGRRWPALRAIPWFPALGDGAASNVGSDCTDPARMALNVGTSAALRIVTTAATPPPRGLWRYRLDRHTSLLGGALSEGGNAYAWCRTVLRLDDDAATEAALARSADDHGLVVLPFFAGERAPGWRGDRRAVLAGLTLDSTALTIARAILEAVALRLRLVYGLLAPRAAPDHLLVGSGGALVASPAWSQIIADTLGRPLIVSPEDEATSRGAALLALDALGRRRVMTATPVPRGTTFVPDPVAHARATAALARQESLDRALGPSPDAPRVERG